MWTAPSSGIIGRDESVSWVRFFTKLNRAKNQHTAITEPETQKSLPERN